MPMGLNGVCRQRLKRPIPPRQKPHGSPAVALTATWTSVTRPSSLRRTHAPILVPLPTFIWVRLAIFAGCCEPLLQSGPSRRYSADLSSRAWTSTPAASEVHVLVSSLRTLAFPSESMGRRIANLQQLFQLGGGFRGCNHSLMFRPASLLVPPIAPTLASRQSFPIDAGRPGLLRPRISRLVACPVQRIY
jgi:hypothetical protein